MTSFLMDPRLNEPIDIRIPDLKTSRHALAVHQSRRPEPGTPGFTTWCERKERLNEALELAQSAPRTLWSKPFKIPEKQVP